MVRAKVLLLALYLFVLPLGSMLATPRSAHAQDQSQAELIQDAHAAASSGDHAEARKLFKRANDKRPTAVLWAAIAQESAALGDRAEAVRAGRAALGHPVEALGPSQRQQMLAIVQTALQSLGEYIMDVQPADAEIAVDGEPVVLGPERSILLEPGPHSIHFLRDGYLPRSFELTSKAGDRQSVQLRLERPLRPVFGGEDITEPEEEDDDDFPVVPVVITSIGVATLIAGGITALVALDNEGDLEDRCGDAPQFCPNRNTALRSSAEDLAVATNVLWVVGGLTTAVGVTWLVLDLTGDDEEEEEQPFARASLDVGPDRAGLSLYGAF